MLSNGGGSRIGECTIILVISLIWKKAEKIGNSFCSSKKYLYMFYFTYLLLDAYLVVTCTCDVKSDEV